MTSSIILSRQEPRPMIGDARAEEQPFRLPQKQADRRSVGKPTASATRAHAAALRDGLFSPGSPFDATDLAQYLSGKLFQGLPFEGVWAMTIPPSPPDPAQPFDMTITGHRPRSITGPQGQYSIDILGQRARFAGGRWRLFSELDDADYTVVMRHMLFLARGLRPFP